MIKANLIALLILKIAGNTNNSSPIADILHCAIVVDNISKRNFSEWSCYVCFNFKITHLAFILVRCCRVKLPPHFTYTLEQAFVGRMAELYKNLLLRGDPKKSSTSDPILLFRQISKLPQSLEKNWQKLLLNTTTIIANAN